ncbi:MAG: hypothetical protein ACXAEU_13735 [Candidatus Hodarchaeales archaeon]|jgi:hypothetical protein
MAVIFLDEQVTFVDETVRAVLVYSGVTTYGDELSKNAVMGAVEETDFFDLYGSIGGATRQVANKVWDTVDGCWNTWLTDDYDYNGAEYPGSGTWGVETMFYRVLPPVYEE